jgi:hypothetical protein
MTADDLPSVADLVNRLFRERLHPSGRPYTNREVGIALRRGHKIGPSISIGCAQAGFKIPRARPFWTYAASFACRRPISTPNWSARA